ncbi:MAG: FAD-dependent oxidoreductase [Clostridiales bacterium]
MVKKIDKTIKKALVIIGGGPGGMAAAIAAWDKGIKDILIIERDNALGGILNQCIHNGFGLHKFDEELTGPEYAYRYEEQINSLGIPYMLETMVTDISSNREITAINETDGIMKIQGDAIILAMGCRERSRGALNIPGSRPSGVYTAGAAQRFVNIRGYMPGKKVVILGSGDIGLIMARRMTLEGGKVEAVIELLPFSGGLKRNIVQCLDDFDIPLYLSHTVTEIHGKNRVNAITMAEVDGNRNPIPGTEKLIECDTLLLSVGLIPENELSKKAGVPIDPVTGGALVNNRRETGVPGIFSCGNVLHVHDVVDFVSEEAEIAGASAANYLLGKRRTGKVFAMNPGVGVRYIVPQAVDITQGDTKVFLRSDNVYRDVYVVVSANGSEIARQKKRIVTPGEMEIINLDSQDLTSIDGNTITIEVKEK